MARFLIVFALALFCAGEAFSQATLDLKYNGTCVTQAITSTTTDDFYVVSGGRLLDVQAEDDTAGAGSGFSVDVYVCDEADYPNRCKLYVSGNFLGTLDGVTADMRGFQEAGVAGYLYFDVTALGSGTPSLKVCAR